MKAQTVIDVILGEAVHGTNAQRYEDMLGIASVIYNRSVSTSASPRAVVAAKAQFDAYNKNLPDGADKYRSLAEKAWKEVQTKGPVHKATYYATPTATKNLPDGLEKVTQTKGHVYFEDPQNRPVVTTEGAIRPDPSALAAVQSAPSVEEFIANNPQPGGFGLAGLAYDDPNMSVPTPTPRPRGSGGLGMAALEPAVTPAVRGAPVSRSEGLVPYGVRTAENAAALDPYLTPDKGRSHLQFNNDFGSRLEKFLADAPGGGIKVYSGFRSIPHQAELFRDAVKKYGSVAAARRNVAPPGKSNHNFGKAADLRYATPEARQWAHDNARKYGLHFRIGHEPWHIEPLPGHAPYEKQDVPVPTSREQALATLTGNATASQAAGLGAQAPVTGTMPESMPAPAADARVAAAHETAPAFQVNTPYTPFPAATAPAPVEVASAGTYLPPLEAAPVSPVERGGPLAPPAGLGAVPIPTPRPSVSLPDQAPIPTARPSDGAMGAIPIPTPRTDTAAPAMASARTISDMPVAQDAGQFPGAGRDYFPPAPAPYFPPAPGANSGAFDSSPFWQTNTGGLGKFGGILKGAATGAAVGGLPGALVGGLLGSGALQKIFNNTPGGGNPSAPAAAAHGGYVGSGVNAMASVFSGKAAPGSLAASRSNPGTYAMSLPGGLVARSYESPTHGYITGIYGLGPNDDTNPGAKFGKVAALSPDAKSWSFVSPEEARGLQAKGWSVSIGPASKASVAAPADPSKAKAAVSPAPATTRAAVARSQAKEATPGKLGKAVADIGKAVAQAFGLGNMGLGIGGLGAAPSMASPSLAAPSMYGLVGQSGIGMGGIAGTGLGGYMGAGMGGGWSEANGPAGNRA